LPASCQLAPSQLPVICQPAASQLPASCQPAAGRLPASCQMAGRGIPRFTRTMIGFCLQLPSCQPVALGCTGGRGRAAFRITVVDGFPHAPPPLSLAVSHTLASRFIAPVQNTGRAGATDALMWLPASIKIQSIKITINWIPIHFQFIHSRF